MCKISIIIPVYNTEKYLRQCLDSIQGQTYKNIEVILIDDGSTDDSGKICDDYSSADSRFRTYHIANGGPAAARNYGMEICCGKYIMFVDSDDWIDEQCLSKCIHHINENNADIAMFNWREVKMDSEITNYKMLGCENRVFEGEEIRKLEKLLIIPEKYIELPNVALAGPVCKLINRECIKNCKYPDELSYAEDFCFIAQLLKNTRKVVYFEDILYSYRIMENSLSHGVGIDAFLENNVEFTNWIIEYYEKTLEADVISEFCFKNYCEVVSKIIIEKRSIDKKLQEIEKYTKNIKYLWDISDIDYRCKNKHLQIIRYLIYKKRWRLLIVLLKIIQK